MNLEFTVQAVNPGPDTDRVLLVQVPSPTIKIAQALLLDLTGAERGRLQKGDTLTLTGEVTAVTVAGPLPALVAPAAPAVDPAVATYEQQLHDAEQRLADDANAVVRLRASEVLPIHHGPPSQ